MSASDPSMLPKPILASRGPSTYVPSRAASRPSGFDPSRRITSRSPEALALGSRRHFIPASLSLPRARVPFLPVSRLHSVPGRAATRRRYADPPAGAFFSRVSRPVSGLRFRAAHTLPFYVDDGTSAPRAQSFLTRPRHISPVNHTRGPSRELGRAVTTIGI